MATKSKSATDAKDDARHPTWAFVGARSREGRPLEFFTSIPARDLTERDVNALTDEDYAIVVASPLYEEAKTPKGKEEGSGSKPDTDPPAE